MSVLSGRVWPTARAVCVRYCWKRRHFGHWVSCRKGVWCAPLWCRTRICERVTYNMVMEASTRSMVLMVPLGVMVEVPAGRGPPQALPPGTCGW